MQCRQLCGQQNNQTNLDFDKPYRIKALHGNSQSTANHGGGRLRFLAPPINRSNLVKSVKQGDAHRVSRKGQSLTKGSGRLFSASKMFLRRGRYYSVLGFAFLFFAGRLRRGAPADGSFSTEYSCGRVWRARNPSAPRQTFAGQVRRILSGVRCGGRIDGAAGTAGRFRRSAISAMTASSAPS